MSAEIAEAGQDRLRLIGDCPFLGALFLAFVAIAAKYFFSLLSH
jgi:hypothetical protein